MAHAFKVGQLVEYTPRRTGLPASIQKYEILKQMPPDEGGENQYRIKCKTETFERVAREGELKRRT